MIEPFMTSKTKFRTQIKPDVRLQIMLYFMREAKH
jgi:hypothetical protein